MMRSRRFSVLGVSIGLLLFAGNAAAFSDAEFHWADVIEFGFGQDGHVTADESLVYSHVFDDPALDVGQVVAMKKVRLSVLLSDRCETWIGCRYDLRNHDEWAVIEVDGEQIYNGDFNGDFYEIVVRDVTLFVDVTARGEDFAVTIASANEEDFQVLFSVADFYYDDSTPGARRGTTPMPEPSAAVVFGVGLLLLSRRIRR